MSEKSRGRVLGLAAQGVAILVYFVFGICPAAAQSPEAERVKLARQLVAKGDGLRDKNKESARAAYQLARHFVGGDTGDKSVVKPIEDKIVALGGQTLNLLGQAGRMQEAFDAVESTADFTNFPKRNVGSDIVNLRMLLDQKLVPDPLFTKLQVPGVLCNLILAKPDLTMSQIREAYGASTTERLMKNGGLILTYGMFRIFGDKGGRAVTVVYGQ